MNCLRWIRVFTGVVGLQMSLLIPVIAQASPIREGNLQMQGGLRSYVQNYVNARLKESGFQRIDDMRIVGSKEYQGRNFLLCTGFQGHEKMVIQTSAMRNEKGQWESGGSGSFPLDQQKAITYGIQGFPNAGILFVAGFVRDPTVTLVEGVDGAGKIVVR